MAGEGVGGPGHRCSHLHPLHSQHPSTGSLWDGGGSRAGSICARQGSPGERKAPAEEKEVLMDGWRFEEECGVGVLAVCDRRGTLYNFVELCHTLIVLEKKKVAAFCMNSYFIQESWWSKSEIRRIKIIRQILIFLVESFKTTLEAGMTQNGWIKMLLAVKVWHPRRKLDLSKKVRTTYQIFHYGGRCGISFWNKTFPEKLHSEGWSWQDLDIGGLRVKCSRFLSFGFLKKGNNSIKMLIGINVIFSNNDNFWHIYI